MTASPVHGLGHQAMEWVAFACAAILVALSLYDVPRPWPDGFPDVRHLALILGGATIALLLVTRFLGRTGIAIEITWAAIFLAGMPLVYILSLVQGGVTRNGAWLWVEILGFPVYAALAFFGLKRRPWLLAAGVAAHGLAWDAWHYLLHSDYIPAWYTSGCFLVDVGLGLYFAARLPRWRAWRGSEGEP